MVVVPFPLSFVFLFDFFPTYIYPLETDTPNNNTNTTENIAAC